MSAYFMALKMVCRANEELRALHRHQGFPLVDLKYLIYASGADIPKVKDS